MVYRLDYKNIVYHQNMHSETVTLQLEKFMINSTDMLLKVTTFIVVSLAAYIHYIEGIDRVIVVSERSDIDDDLAVSYDIDVPAIGATGNARVSGSRVFKVSLTLTLCCTFGNCSCPSLYTALANLTSNVLINITTDVTLFSIISLADLANITIAGHNNPTVNCNSSGGLHFISCHNCIIEGISWDGCGNKNIMENVSRPVLQMINSSNITIKNCSFQHSIGQAVVLSQMTGYVTITHSSFLSNSHYEGHGSAIHYSSNDMPTSSVTFMIVNSNFTHNEGAKSVVCFYQSSASFKSCEYLYLRNSNFCHNKEVPIYLSNQNLYISGNIEFNGNAVENGGGIYISDHSNVTIHKSASVKFTHNRANRNGGAIFLSNNSSIVFKEHHILQQCYDPDDMLYYTVADQYLERSLIIVFYNNTANKFGGNIYAHNSKIIFGDTADVKFDGNSCLIPLPYNNSERSIVHISDQSIVIFEGNSIVTFSNYCIFKSDDNLKVVMFIYSSSTITFEGNSTVNFIANGAVGNGGVMYIDYNSTIKFEGNSTVNFIDNQAGVFGGVMYIFDSSITFGRKCIVNFIDNGAFDHGGVMYIDYNSTITFEGDSTVSFNNNSSGGNGGVMYIDDHYSTITFKGNSTVNFNNNSAVGNGGVMYTGFYSTITFERYSTVNLIHNGASGNGGAMYISYNSTIIFEGKSTVNFTDNYGVNGGVMYIDNYSAITFEGNSIVSFTDNIAANGGVMYIDYSRCTIIFAGNSTIKFIDNGADSNGGVMYTSYYSTIIFDENCTLSFIHNGVNGNGGAMYIDYNSTIIFGKNSSVTFTDSFAAGNGGLIYIDKYSTITFEENSTVNFIDNYSGGNGGVMYIENYSVITFDGNCTLNLIDNDAHDYGGAMYIDTYSAITFEGNTAVNFIHNGAGGNGGAMYINFYSTIKFKGNSIATFYHNHANSNGGVIYIDLDSNLRFEEKVRVIFNGNIAYLGGSVYIKFSYFIIDRNSSVLFINNTALKDGGAIYLKDQSEFELLAYSSTSFYYNSASDYGGAIYALYDEWTSMNFYNHTAYFKGNTAGTTQNSVYINVNKSCDRNCFLNSIAKNNYIPLTTSPNRLVLYNPTKCSNGNETDCDTYYMNNIMLGQDITFNACLLDYYDQPTEAAEFLITGKSHQDYNISSSKYISVSCNRTTQGITVTGNLESNNKYNYSINISLHVTRFSESKVVSVNLIVELSQCHPGFYYSPANESRKCECYNTGDIISCSGSNSTIKRGYWYGSVTGIPTVATCPDDYCNFTCCEITNGIYHLSPVRANQCRPHRSGTACSNCEEGYTLSFDSPKCVEVNRCTFGLILVITLSLLYWIAVVIAVFVMMYFKVAFGSLYGIAYYYSIIDILLRQALFISNGLYTTVAIMSSLAKLTPQFLGQLCLARNMSGIDQQFIHYVHPVVVFLILVMISILARKSRRVSLFVSKGIISFICFLLLLSYTSVASTSLLFMRPLTFEGIDKVYTYLSPDIEYFHVRHLAYATVALVLTIIIAIGFPLLLILEPFLNSKINFIKIKPLLDQFQGCYKDKYRYFASYYMICRLVIILLVIVKISDDFTTQYLLILSCALMQLIHVLVRPYASTIHNIFDGIILQLIVIISVLPVIEFVDQYDEIFVIVIIYVLLILPLISFIAIKVWINKDIIQIVYYKCNISCYYNEVATDDPQEPVEIREFCVIVDENMRRNAIIVDV